MTYHTPALKIRGTDAIIGRHELFFLTYPVESSIQTFITEEVLLYNCARNPRFRESKPLLILIGNNPTAQSKHAVQVDPFVNTISFTEVTPSVLLEMIYQTMVHNTPSAIIISGFNNISFKKETPSELINDIEIFYAGLKGIQREFFKPTLITTTVHPRHADSDVCIPKFDLDNAEFELATDRHNSIKTDIGAFHLFHSPRENPKPIKILSGKKENAI